MKIRPLSDLHIEFSPFKIAPMGEDILILAGDICNYTEAMPQLKIMARQLDIPILVIAGNHEYYRNQIENSYTWESLPQDMRNAADFSDRIEKGRVTFLEDSVVIYGGIRIIGATLWTDMLLYGDDPLVKLLVKKALNDYYLIQSKYNHLLQIDQVIERHKISRKFIQDTLAQKFDGKTVVVTHHSPSWLSVAPQYRNDKVSAGFASRLEYLIQEGNPTLWIHGHTHISFDYQLYDTRIVCNPRGYNDENPNFNPNLLVEI